MPTSVTNAACASRPALRTPSRWSQRNPPSLRSLHEIPDVTAAAGDRSPIVTAKAQTLNPHYGVSAGAGAGAASVSGADLISAVAGRSNEDLLARLEEVFRVKAAAEGEA